MGRVCSSQLLAKATGTIVAPLLLALTFALWPAALYAAEIQVNGTTCKLPDAIQAANTDATAGGCTSGSGADTLVISGVHTLATVVDHSNGSTATPIISSTIVISGGVGGATVERGDKA